MGGAGERWLLLVGKGDPYGNPATECKQLVVPGAGAKDVLSSGGRAWTLALPCPCRPQNKV